LVHTFKTASSRFFVRKFNSPLNLNSVAGCHLLKVLSSRLIGDDLINPKSGRLPTQLVIRILKSFDQLNFVVVA
jgi:hypothetical protein